MKPYLSIVTAARNDNFGGNFLNRLQASVNSIITLSNKYELPIELIIVDWNPPKTELKLKDAIKWPVNIKPEMVKIIEVSNEIHNKFKNSDKIPFFEFYAKNAGIRRANGEYILVTNSDIIFSDKIMEYFAKKNLSQDVFCRADRYDIKGLVPLNIPFEDQLKFCEKNVFCINTMHGAMLTSKSEWFKTKIIGKIKRLSFKKIKEKLEQLAGKLKTSQTNISSPSDDYTGLYLHNGGDFMLMSKENWEKLKGYPETGVDRGLDCYMTIMTHISGLLQVVLPYHIYHPDHDRTVQLLRPTLILQNIPAFNQMIKTNQPVITNDGNWGLKNKQLQETIIK